MNVVSNVQKAGPWGNQNTLDELESKHQGLMKDGQKEALPKVNTLDPQGRIWMGSYPGAGETEEALRKLDVLINELGIKTFLCLQETEELEELSPYLPLCEKVVSTKDPSKRAPNFMHFSIRDVDIADDKALLTYLKTVLIPKIEKGDILPLYIHCKGGNGRTGTVSALLLTHLFGLDAFTALEKVAAYHSTRRTPIFSAPETYEQKSQVVRLAPLLNKEVEEVKK